MTKPLPNLIDLVKTWLTSKNIAFECPSLSMPAINIDDGNLQLIMNDNSNDISDNEMLIISTKWYAARDKLSSFAGLQVGPDKKIDIGIWIDHKGNLSASDVSLGNKFLIGFNRLDCRDKNFFEDLEKIIQTYFARKEENDKTNNIS